MISQVYLDPRYWILVPLILFLCARFLRARFADFNFIVLLFLVQYAVHSSLVFGLISEISIFCDGFLLVYLLTSRIATRSRPLHSNALSSSAFEWLDFAWFKLSRLFLFFYFAARLGAYPFFDGALAVDERLTAQSGNPVIFYAGLVVVPALAACTITWLVHGMKWPDYVVLGIVVIGMFGSGSKAAFLPLVLVLSGVVALQGIPWSRLRLTLILGLVGALGAFGRLLLYFPDTSTAEVIRLFFYRIFSNTDSLEYLRVINTSPSAYPFAGPGALFPTLTKLMGGLYQYSPGVWLHGTVYGDWRGFGPNPGITMDYFGNLAWFGLAAAAVLALYMHWGARIGGPIGAAFLSIGYLTLVDVTLFEVAFAFWSVALVLLMAIRAAKILETRKSRNTLKSHNHSVTEQKSVKTWIEAGSGVA